MKVRILALSILVLFMASCTSTGLGNLYPKKRRMSFLAGNLKLPKEFTIAIKNGDIVINMNRHMVIASIGTPWKINRSTGSWGIHEQWVMSAPSSFMYMYGRGRQYGYVYFENGKVTSWQSE